MSNGRHFLHPSGGPAWSRDRGYHTPTSLPPHIMRIITTKSEPNKSEPQQDRGTKERK